MNPYRLEPQCSSEPATGASGRELFTALLLAAFGLLPFAGMALGIHVQELDLAFATLFLIVLLSGWSRGASPDRKASAAR